MAAGPGKPARPRSETRSFPGHATHRRRGPSIVGRGMPFWLSIACLSVFQGVLVALPVRASLERRCGGCAPAAGPLVLPVSIVAFVAIARAAETASAQGLTYLALVAVPPLAALALGALSAAPGRARALWAGALFALAWADRGGFAGNAAATLLSGLSCVALGSLLGAITPPRWLAAGIVAMALADTALVVSDLLAGAQRRAERRAPGGRAAAAAERDLRLSADGLRRPVRGGGVRRHACRRGAHPALRGRAHRRRSRSRSTCCSSAVNELPATVPVALALGVLRSLTGGDSPRTQPLRPRLAFGRVLRGARPAADPPARPARRSPAP